jgi:NTE family protein
MLKNIVFSGGAFKGWAYIGTLRALYELVDFHNIESIVGVSIGSVFALFYILQIDYRFLLDFIMKINYYEIIDVNIDHLIINQSLIDGIQYIKYIQSIIAQKIDPDITFIELYRFSRIKFTVPALNITDSRIDYFDYENTPNIKVIDAILASSSIPLLFPPVKLNNKFYYDGGLCNNCPVNIVPEICSICFDLDNSEPINNNKIKILDLIYTFTKLVHKSNNINKHLIHQILDSRFEDELLNINQTPDDIFNIYMTGYINSRNIIYNNFIAIKN